MSDTAPAAPSPTLENFGSLIQHNMSQPVAPPKAPAKAPTQAPSENFHALVKPANDVTPVPAGEAGDEELASVFEADKAEPTEGDEEQTEQIQDLLEEAIHGRKGREILESIKAGQLPEELAAALKGVAKINGQDVPVSFAEALKGYQRMGDYTRSKQELQRERAEVREAMQSVNGLFESWNNGESLIAGIKRLGKAKEFGEAAMNYVREQWQEEQLRKQNPDAWQARQEVKAERERREALEQQLKAQPNPRAERQTQALADQIESLVFPAFEASSIKDTPFARERFSENFRALFNEGDDLGQVVQDAVRATADQLSDLAAKYQAQQAANDNGKPKLNPAPLPPRAAPPASGAKPAKQKPMTPGDMDELLRANRSKRRF